MPTSKPRRIFLDTNILVYDADVSEPPKKQQASQLLHDLFAVTRPILSAQVLSEYVSVATRKLSPPLPIPVLQVTLNQLSVACEVLPITSAEISSALQVVMTKSVSWWDALIHATAVAGNVTDVLSEDLVHLGVMDHITYHNPFEPSFSLQKILTS